MAQGGIAQDVLRSLLGTRLDWRDALFMVTRRRTGTFNRLRARKTGELNHLMLGSFEGCSSKPSERE
jgi:hypothetical protein